MNDHALSVRRIAKRAAIGFALGAAAMLGAQQLSAQAIAGFNSRQPVDYAADRIELQDRADRVVLSGNVVVKQGDLRLTAGRTIVNYTDSRHAAYPADHRDGRRHGHAGERDCARQCRRLRLQSPHDHAGR